MGCAFSRRHQPPHAARANANTPTAGEHALGAAERVVGKADRRAQRLCHAAHRLRAGHHDTARRAGEVGARVVGHFDEVQRHRGDLQQSLQRARKAACQGVGDAGNLAYLLACAVRAAGALPSALRAEVTGCETLSAWTQWRPLVRPRAASIAFACPPTPLSVLRVSTQACWGVEPSTPPTPIARMLTARDSHAAAVTPAAASQTAAAAAVVVVSGFSNSRLVGDVECYQAASDSWQLASSIPAPRSDCGACAVGSAVIVVGGLGRNGQVLGTVSAFDTAQNVWRQLPPLPSLARGCAVAGWQGRVFVVGGFDGRKCTALAWELDTSEQDEQQMTWAQLPRISGPRVHLGAAAGDKRVFVCGGTNGSVFVANCEVLHIATRRWHPLPPMPTPRSNFGCCFGGGNVFVAGGNSATGYLRSACVFVAHNRTWVELADLSCARQGCAAVCLGRSLLVLGGDGGSGSLRTCEAYRF